MGYWGVVLGRREGIVGWVLWSFGVGCPWSHLFEMRDDRGVIFGLYGGGSRPLL
jgi:hypothetical protein